MRNKPSWSQRLRYSFDNTLARGPAALIAWLGLATIALIAIAILIDLVLGGTAPGLGPREVFWNILFQALVPNPPGDFESPWQFILVMLGVTLASLLVVSILIGLLSATIENRVETLRRGRSQVIESNHTVILGWSEQVFATVSELVIANENQRRAAIAILGEHDQVEMEDEIRHRIKSMGPTRVVCRRGNPTQHDDLNLVSPQTSKSIIILTADDDEHPDATTIKTILALTNAQDRRPEPYQIVGVLHNNSNEEIARLVGNGEVALVKSGDVIAKIMAQTCRQAGLSKVYMDLCDFSGDEIYFHEEPQLVGKTFGEALLAYEDSAVMGIATAAGAVLLKPPMDTLVATGDKIIALSKDDDTIHLSGLTNPPLQQDAILDRQNVHRSPEHTLILGWNWRAATIIEQLDAYVAPGSSVKVVAKYGRVEAEIAKLRESMHNQELSYLNADTTNRVVLEGLQIATYDHVLILCYSDNFDHQRADSITLLTLLHLRTLADAAGYKFSLVTEMMDVRNRDIAEGKRADDFIVSERLISLMTAQISENMALSQIFENLLDPTGVEIYLKPISDYVKLGTPVSFYTVVQSARQRNEVAIGYRIPPSSVDSTQGDQVILNPTKSTLVTFNERDRIIVVSENEY